MGKKLSAGIACSNRFEPGTHGYAHAFIDMNGKPYLNLCDTCYNAWSKVNTFTDRD